MPGSSVTSPALSASASAARSIPSPDAACCSVARSVVSLAAARTRACCAAWLSWPARCRNACEILADTSTGAPSGASARSPGSAASSSSASGLPAVARCSSAAVSAVSPGMSWAASSLVRPLIWSAGRSAPSSRDGSPSRTATKTAIGSATSLRNANSSACALDTSSHWASSTRTATGACSAYAASMLSVAAPTANRSCAVPRRSASAPSSATACGSGILSSMARAGRSSSSREPNGICASDLIPRARSTRIPVARSAA